MWWSRVPYLILILHHERKYFVENKTDAYSLSDSLKVMEPVSGPAGTVDADPLVYWRMFTGQLFKCSLSCLLANIFI